MEPIRETTEAVDELGSFVPVGDLVDQLRAAADRVRAVVPSCVGLSLGSVTEGITFTLVATDDEIAALDGVQYLARGPCVDAVGSGQTLELGADDLADEDAWHLFSRATSTAGIASTLTLPILTRGRVSGSVNLYAADPGAFAGHHDEIAGIFGAWAPGAVANADLSFATRREAERAPDRLRESLRVEVAIGLLVEAEALDVDTARDRLREAARRAGISEQELAEALIESRGSLPE